MQPFPLKSTTGAYQNRPRVKALWQILVYVIAAFCIIVPLRFFVAQPFVVSGGSMEPAFNPNEYLVIDEVTYRNSEPQRGDVVIFRYPLDPSIYFIKRIVGIPGETVKIENGVVSVADQVHPAYKILNEPYARIGKNMRTVLPTTLSSGEYFVLGDNRDASADSRVWGPLEKRFIIGRAILRLYPFNEVQFFPGKYEFSK